MSGQKIYLEKNFLELKSEFILGEGATKEKFQLFKLDRPVKSMKNKSTIFLKAWPRDSDIHKPESIVQLETFWLDDSDGCT